MISESKTHKYIEHQGYVQTHSFHHVHLLEQKKQWRKANGQTAQEALPLKNTDESSF